ncbi:MAG: DUF2339 domain-containing protein [Holophagaceae bacterium]
MTVPPEDPDRSQESLEKRLARLEQWVEWLVAQEKARGNAPGRPAEPRPGPGMASPRAAGAVAVEAPAPAPEVAPAPRPPAPSPAAPASKPFNASVLVAAFGAGIFLLGVIFFLWLSFQRGWIGPEMRILLGLAGGLGLGALAAKLMLGGRRALGVCFLLAGLGTLQFTLWAASASYHFIDPAVGFVAVAAVTFFAGGLAARCASPAALVVTLVSAFLAPPIFSTGAHHEVALSVYLALLTVAALAVPYVAGVGARWGTNRWLLLAVQWMYQCVIFAGGRSEDRGLLVILMLVHFGLSFLWIWLPKQKEAKPSTPTLLWFITSLMTLGLAGAYWDKLGLEKTWFAGPCVAFGALHLGLVRPMRARLGTRQADLGLLVLAAGHLAIAVPVALAWRWVGPMWGAFALLLALAASKAEALPEWEPEERFNLTLLAVGMALLASLRWVIVSADAWDRTRWLMPSGAELSAAPTPFLNSLFALGLLATLAWGLLARRGGVLGALGFLGLQVVGVLTISSELAYAVVKAGFEPRTAGILVTLLWAGAGAGQWLKSLSMEARGPRLGFAIAGYGWLGLASFKLIVFDLASSDLALKAAVFLGVGLIFLGAALVGSRARRRDEPDKEDA